MYFPFAFQIQMLGYDISWAGFNIIEVMSSSKFTCKRVGYLAASQCFHPDSELIMLTTNMIRKDLNSQSQYDAGVALSGLSCFISADLSRDLANDIITLMSSTKPYLRMKAVLMMYKVFLRYPEALRPAFPKLKEKLEDPDPGVQSAAVNVICELARKNPKNYLSLAPIFFKLMTTSTNNWMLIKIIKLVSERRGAEVDGWGLITFFKVWQTDYGRTRNREEVGQTVDRNHRKVFLF